MLIAGCGRRRRSVGTRGGMVQSNSDVHGRQRDGRRGGTALCFRGDRTRRAAALATFLLTDFLGKDDSRRRDGVQTSTRILPG